MGERRHRRSPRHQRLQGSVADDRADALGKMLMQLLRLIFLTSALVVFEVLMRGTSSSDSVACGACAGSGSLGEGGRQCAHGGGRNSRGFATGQGRSRVGGQAHEGGSGSSGGEGDELLEAEAGGCLAKGKGHHGRPPSHG